MQEADTIIADAKEGNVAFLVVGDPFGYDQPSQSCDYTPKVQISMC